MAKYEFYKNKETDRIYWVNNTSDIGLLQFSFDREKIYNLFSDYPNSLSEKEKQIFDEENPFWADFFKDRKN